MAIDKRQGKKGTRYRSRVRLRGRRLTKTFATKAAADAWEKAQEGAIIDGKYKSPFAGRKKILADAIDAMLAARKRVHRAPGKSFADGLKRLKEELGLEAAADIDWLAYALKRMEGDEGVEGQTVASDLAYATSVLKHAAQDDPSIDPRAPGRARTALREMGVRVVSRERNRRITDAELTALLKWIDKHADQTSIPLRDLIEFALATAMRRGEILALRWDDISGRVARFRRKHPRERDRIEDVPLLKANDRWPRWDALDIIARQPRDKREPRVFPYKDDTVGERFEWACKGAGLKGIVFHQLRHESLSRYAQERKFDVLRLKKIGGHRDVRNLQRYVQIDGEALANE